MNRREKIRTKARMWRKVKRNSNNSKYTPHRGGGEYVETPGSIRSAASAPGFDFGVAALIAAMARPYKRRRR